MIMIGIGDYLLQVFDRQAVLFVLTRVIYDPKSNTYELCSISTISRANGQRGLARIGCGELPDGLL